MRRVFRTSRALGLFGLNIDRSGSLTTIYLGTGVSSRTIGSFSWLLRPRFKTRFGASQNWGFSEAK